MASTWGSSEQAMLTSLWPTHSASTIAGMLGRSRNAIVGQAHRLKLVKKAPTTPKPVRFLPEPKPVTQITEPDLAPDYVADPVPLLEAGIFQCKAVIEGQVDANGLAMVCGKEVSQGQPFSFCTYHLNRFTVRGDTRWHSPRRI